MKKGLLLLFYSPLFLMAQQTYVPDDNFEQALINQGYDNMLDDYVATANIDILTYLDVSYQNIYDLTGIEDFTVLSILYCGVNALTILDISNNTALTSLNCGNNYLTNLDVSQNTALTFLDCRSNQLTSLDVSLNTALTSLDCGNNYLSNLDVSNNTNFEYLVCDKNSLTSLDVSANTALAELFCEENQLTSFDVNTITALEILYCYDNQLFCLDISNNINLDILNCSNNLLEQLNTRNSNWANLDILADSNNLTCVEVDNLGYANNNWLNAFDNSVTFNTNCNYTNPCATVSDIQEYSTNTELLKITDLLGRETKNTKNKVLFYIYNDGTVEKRIIVE